MHTRLLFWVSYAKLIFYCPMYWGPQRFTASDRHGGLSLRRTAYRNCTPRRAFVASWKNEDKEKSNGYHFIAEHFAQRLTRVAFSAIRHADH